MAGRTVSRRDFLKVVGAVSGAAVLASCTPATPVVEDEQPEATKQPEATQASDATAAPEEQPAEEPVGPELEGNLVVWLGGWTPSESMEVSEDNPNPHNKLIDVLDAYMTKNPGVEVEWIRVPAGIDQRTWTVTQQAGGTIPHIVEQPAYWIDDDLDKDWWVDLTPFLEEPNPYIAEGDLGSEHWLDEFWPIPLSEAKVRGSFYNLPLGLVTTLFFYNVDWFKEVGVSEPETYSEFLSVCEAFKQIGVNAYGGAVMAVEDTDHWYRIQLGGMLMARDIEPLVNPDRNTATPEEVACAIKNGVYHPRLPQYREWMELWKLNVPYRNPDWTVPDADDLAMLLQKKQPIAESGIWAKSRLMTDPLMDFEWGTFFAPTLTKDLSEFVTDPPTTAWPIGGAVGDEFAVTTRAKKDGLLEETIDLLRWLTTPENLNTVQGEIGTWISTAKEVPCDPAFQSSYDKLTGKIGESQMFIYEEVKMDNEASMAIGQAWRAYLLDQMELDDAIDVIDDAFTTYADRFVEKEGITC